MLVQVVDVLDDSVLERGAHRDVVEDRKVLHVLAQSDAAGVRADGHAKLRREKHHGETLVDTTESAGIDLAEPDRVGLHELFVPEPHRRKAHAKTLLLEVFRRMRDELIAQIDFACNDDYGPGIALAKKLGFEELDAGVAYRLA